MLDRIGLGLGLLVFALIGLFFTSMWTETPDWRVVGVLVGLGAACIVAGHLSLGSSTPLGDIGILIWRGSFDLFSFLIFGFGAWLYINAYRRIPEMRSLILAIALLAVCVSYPMTFFGYDLANYVGVQMAGMNGFAA